MRMVPHLRSRIQSPAARQVLRVSVGEPMQGRALAEMGMGQAERRRELDKSLGRD